MPQQIIEPSFTETKTNIYSLGDDKKIHVVSIVYGFELGNPTKLIQSQILSKKISDLMNDYQMGYDEIYAKPQPEYLIFDRLIGVAEPKMLTANIDSKSKTIAQLPQRVIKINNFGKYEVSTEANNDEVLLSYNNAYGGKKYLNNPMGTGYFDGEKEFKLPIFEYPNDMVKSPIDKDIAPAGFAALHPTAKQRHQNLGKYSKSQEKALARNPSLPANLKPEFFMMSAKDQWLESLDAGVNYKLEGFGSVIKGKLPKYKVLLTTQDTNGEFARYEGKVDTFAIFPSLNIGILATKFVFETNSIQLDKKYPVMMTQIEDMDMPIEESESEEALKNRLGEDRELYSLKEDDLMSDSLHNQLSSKDTVADTVKQMNVKKDALAKEVFGEE